MRKRVFFFFFLFFGGGVLFSLPFEDYLVLMIAVVIQTLVSFHRESRNTVCWVSQELTGLVQPWPQHFSWAYHTSCFSPLPLLNKMFDSPHFSIVALPAIHKRPISAANSVGFLFLLNHLPETKRLKTAPIYDLIVLQASSPSEFWEVHVHLTMGWNQGASWVRSRSGGSGEERSSMLSQVAGWTQCLTP